MASSTPLADTIVSYVTSRAAQQAANTVRSDRVVLGKLLAHVGNVPTGELTPQHVESFRLARADDLCPSSMNTCLGVLQSFTRWALALGHMSNPGLLATWRKVRVMPNDPVYIPAWRFPELLDAAGNPRDRAVLALGLHLMLRSNEIERLRVGDVDLKAGRVRTEITKTGDLDYMPVSVELDAELRSWLTLYSSQRKLHSDHFLFPKQKNVLAKGGGRQSWLIPDEPVRRIYKVVQAALSAMELHQPQEGGHTLRRSGGAALYMRLRDEGVADPLEQVAMMLHHSSLRTTAHYIGLENRKIIRNNLVAGRPMFDTGSREEVVTVQLSSSQRPTA